MKQCYPRFKVIFHRVVPGYAQQARDFLPMDITGFLGDGCSIQTAKSCREAAGTFSITLVDKPLPNSEGNPVSLYAMMSPMDVIEIRITTDPTKEPRLLMRGYISEVRRDQSMGNDGRPSRMIHVSGHDIGKLMMTQMIHFLPGKDSEYILTGFGPLMKYFEQFTTNSKRGKVTAQDFVGAFKDLLQMHLDSIHENGALAKDLTVSAVVPAAVDGTILTLLLTSTGDVSYYDFMSRYLDVGPFNELFLLDTQDGTKLICKPNYYDLEGMNAVAANTGYSYPKIKDEDIVALSSSRSDARVANWFWVWPHQTALESEWTALVQAWKNGSVGDIREGLKDEEPPYTIHNESSLQKYFGYRKMSTGLMLQPPAYVSTELPDTGTVQANEQTMQEWVKEKTKDLRDDNFRNAVLENSVFRIRGDETLKPGTWIDHLGLHYVVRVEHEIQPFGNFVTTLHTERGTSLVRWYMGGELTYQNEHEYKGAI